MEGGLKINLKVLSDCVVRVCEVKLVGYRKITIDRVDGDDRIEGRASEGVE